MEKKNRIQQKIKKVEYVTTGEIEINSRMRVQRAWKILSAIINIITLQGSLRDILPASWPDN